MKNRRSERNLCNCVKKPEKKIQDFKGVISTVHIWFISYIINNNNNNNNF